MDVEKLLTAANKREARQAISDWLNNELRSEIRSEVEKIAKEWVKENRSDLKKQFEIEMKKRVPDMVLRFIDSMRISA